MSGMIWETKYKKFPPPLTPCVKFFVWWGGGLSPKIFFFFESLVKEAFLEKITRKQSYSAWNFPLWREENYYFCYLKSLFWLYQVGITFLKKTSRWKNYLPWRFLCKNTIHSLTWISYKTGKFKKNYFNLKSPSDMNFSCICEPYFHFCWQIVDFWNYFSLITPTIVRLRWKTVLQLQSCKFRCTTTEMENTVLNELFTYYNIIVPL